MKATITIESSIIYPIIFFICVLLIIYTFYMHDKLVITADTYRILIEHTSKKDDITSILDSTKDIKERLNKKCILHHNFNITFDNNHNLIVDSINRYVSRISFKNYERSDFIRKYYTFLNLMRKDN